MDRIHYHTKVCERVKAQNVLGRAEKHSQIVSVIVYDILCVRCFPLSY